MSLIETKILTPAKPILDCKAQSVHVPSLCGFVEVLPNHAAMISEIDVGPLTITDQNGSKQEYFVSGGYVHVNDNSVTVLGDVVQMTDELDLEKAKKAQERAEKRLSDHGDRSVDIPRALSALKRAQARKDFLKSLPSH